jgi:hypothetical protein
VGADNLCHQAILTDNASRAVAPPDTEVIQVGDTKVRSSSSRRQLPIQRSMIEFIRGAWMAERTIHEYSQAA